MKATRSECMLNNEGLPVCVISRNSQRTLLLDLSVAVILIEDDGNSLPASPGSNSPRGLWQLSAHVQLARHQYNKAAQMHDKSLQPTMCQDDNKIYCYKCQYLTALSKHSTTICFNIKKLCILLTEGTYLFRMILTINRDYFSKQDKSVNLCNGNGVLCEVPIQRAHLTYTEIIKLLYFEQIRT
jgi:hypothetical protein